MTLIRLVLAAGMAMLAIMGCQPTKQPGSLSDKDIAAIEEIEQTYLHTMIAGDWKAAAELFAEDAILMGFGRPMEKGRAAIQAHFKGIDITAFEMIDSDIQGEGSVAYLRWAYNCTVYVAGNPNPISYTGKLIEILRRQPDGRWLFTLEIYNSDHPLSDIETES